MSDPNIIDFSEIQPLSYSNSYISVGNFDGVHRGHQAIIKEMIRQAEPQGAPVIVITFFPNPTDFFTHPREGFYLSTPKEKETLLLKMGVTKVITLRFDQDFSNLPARRFLLGLKENFGLHVLVVGHNFTLGKTRLGTIPVIESIGEELDFSINVVKPFMLGEKDISSTLIRQYLDDGNVDGAAELLGRLYTISGEVSHGSDRGSRIGLPTANISHSPLKKFPAVGVYATYVSVNGETFQGVTNIGYRPTFEEQSLPNMETHILDFDGNIYGKKITIGFLKKIREEKKFSGAASLLAQIDQDKSTARRIFENDQS